MARPPTSSQQPAIRNLNKLQAAISKLLAVAMIEFPGGVLKQYHTQDLIRAIELIKTARWAIGHGWYINRG